MSYQVCADTRHVAAGPKMRVEISVDTRFRANWAQIWPNFEIFVKCLYGQEMASYAWKIIEKTQKGPGWGFTPSRHTFRCWAKIQKFHCFSLLNLPCNPQPTCWDVPYGCIYALQALFLKIFDFFEKIEYFWYLDRLWVTKTHRVLWSAKCSRSCFFQVKVRI